MRRRASASIAEYRPIFSRTHYQWYKTNVGAAAAVVVIVVALGFFFFVPVLPGTNGSCIYYPPQQQHQSVSFYLFGVGMTSSYGQLY
ncbi:MAG: hypothetical protein KGI38_00870 [Thaumarchaeota archaeon]|nr:hypothetical protein [Nitrososphaerota archaeon]